MYVYYIYNVYIMYILVYIYIYVIISVYIYIIMCIYIWKTQSERSFLSDLTHHKTLGILLINNMCHLIDDFQQLPEVLLDFHHQLIISFHPKNAAKSMEMSPPGGG